MSLYIQNRRVSSDHHSSRTLLQTEGGADGVPGDDVPAGDVPDGDARLSEVPSGESAADDSHVYSFFNASCVYLYVQPLVLQITKPYIQTFYLPNVTENITPANYNCSGDYGR